MLFSKIEEVQEFTDVNIGVYFESLKSPLRIATRRFLTPVLGVGLMGKIEGYYSSPPSSENEAALLKKVQEALAPLALYIYIPRSEAMITDNGIRRGGTEEMPGAFKYQVKELQDSYLDDGLDALEDVLQFIEQNKADFPDWEAAPERKKYNKLFFRSASDFNTYFKLYRPQLGFQAINPDVASTEDLLFSKIFKETFSALKVKSIAQSASPAESEAIDLLKKAMANITISLAIPKLQVRIDGNGITMMSGNADQTQDASISKRQAAIQSQVSLLQRNCHDIGYQYIDEAVAFLNKNATDSIFPEWHAKMVLEAESQSCNQLNQHDSGVFSM